MANGEDAPFRVVHGISTQTPSLIAVAVRENAHPPTTEDFFGRPGNSTIRWVAVSSHPEQELEEEPALRPPENHPPLPSLRMLSCRPLQRWREPYRLEYISKTSTSLCFANHPLGSIDDWRWKTIC